MFPFLSLFFHLCVCGGLTLIVERHWIYQALQDCHGFTPVGSSAHPATCSFPTPGLRQRHVKRQSRSRAQQQSKPRSSPTAAQGRQVLSHPQGSRAPSRWRGLGQTNAIPASAPPSFCFPSFPCWAWRRMVGAVPGASWAQLSRPCPLPAPGAPQPARWWGGVRRSKALGSVQAPLSSDWNSPVCSALFQHRPHQPHGGLWDEQSLCPSQTQYKVLDK